MHQHHAADPVGLAPRRIEDGRTLVQPPGIDPRKGQDAIGIVHYLEGQHRQRLIVGGAPQHFGIGPRVDPLDRRNIDRRRQIGDHRVEQRLHALVLEGRTAENREEGAGDHRLAEQPLDRLVVDLLARQIGFHRRLVELDAGLDHLEPGLRRPVGEVGRNGRVVEPGAEAFVLPHHRLHPHEIDDALEGRLRPVRQLDRHRLGAEPVADVGKTAVEIGARLVHLVAEHDARHAIFVALAPHRLGLRLDALVRIEDAHRPVEHPQAALDLDREVDMAGRVDDVQALVVPEGGGGSRGDGDPPLLFLLHPVHGGGAIMNLADFVALARIIEDALRGRGLSGIDMGHDAEIAIILDFVFARHGVKSSRQRHQR